MKKIESKGNLPKALQIFAKQVKGANTVFYEGESAKEIEGVAKRKECEELSCVLDPSTNRGYLVGFGFQDTESKLIIEGRDSSIDMKIYFVELNEGDFSRYSQMIKKHKRDQQQDMVRRRDKLKASKPDGGSDDK